jgi:hypothetical protein
MTRSLRTMTLLMLALGVQLVSAATESVGSGDFAGLVDIGGAARCTWSVAARDPLPWYWWLA